MFVHLSYDAEQGGNRFGWECEKTRGKKSSLVRSQEARAKAE